ncbi:hypothetical protein [Pilimelia columellifera]|uniref:Uncharacterized protein n=1 Tax=Pilimelia columellifera subsp. columellifera TaxID=706583 RepID=A0ABP6A650_9ACTN
MIDLEPGSATYGVAAAPDGGIWFTAPGLNQIGRVTAAGDLALVGPMVPDARQRVIQIDAVPQRDVVQSKAERVGGWRNPAGRSSCVDREPAISRLLASPPRWVMTGGCASCPWARC